MNLLPYSKQFKFANQELNWIYLDSEEAYNKHLTHNHTLLQKNNWVNSKFTYKFNSHGFRCNEFSDEPSAMFLGCSFTLGVGLPNEYTWPYILAQTLNYNCVNLGVGGGSNDLAFRLAYHWINKINPKIIFLFSPFKERLEVLNKNDLEYPYHDYTPMNSADDPFYAKWVLTDENSMLQQEKNIMAIANIASKQNIKFVVLNAQTCLDNIQVDYARDLRHPGIQSNLTLANKFIELI
jgi:hypothetical protein